MAGSADGPRDGMVVRSSPLHFQLYRQGIDAPVRWRVLSANNRDMGRGVRDYADEPSCVAGIVDFLAQLGTVVVSLSRTPENRWAFRLVGREEVLATSGHAFDRRTRCERAAARFIELVPDAELRAGVAVLTSASWGRAAVRTAPVCRPNVAPRWTPAGRTVAVRGRTR